MGQYWIPVNLTKREYIHPHKLGAGLKIGEQVGTYPGTGAALLILLAAQPERRGGGDLELDEQSRQVIGRWAGDKIAIVGDYAEDSDLPKSYRASTIYDRCSDEYKGRLAQYTDISDLVATVIERECDGRFEGEDWRDFISPRAQKNMRPDMVISI